jgi:hypothetical protein
MNVTNDSRKEKGKGLKRRKTWVKERNRLQNINTDTCVIVCNQVCRARGTLSMSVTFLKKKTTRWLNKNSHGDKKN